MARQWWEEENPKSDLYEVYSETEPAESPTIVIAGEKGYIKRPGQATVNEWGEPVSEKYVKEIDSTMTLPESEFQKRMPREPSGDELDMFDQWNKKVGPELNAMAIKQFGDPQSAYERGRKQRSQDIYNSMNDVTRSKLTQAQRMSINQDVERYGRAESNRVAAQIKEAVSYGKSEYDKNMTRKLEAKKNQREWDESQTEKARVRETALSDRFEAGRVTAMEKIPVYELAILNAKEELNSRDELGKPIAHSKEKIAGLNKIIGGYETMINELSKKYKLSEQPEAAPKTELLTEEDKAAVKNEFAARVAKGGITDKAALFKEIADKVKAGKTRKQTQTPEVSKPVVTPTAAPVIPAEPPAQAIRPNPNKARIISKPSPGMALRNMTTAPTPIEYEAADQELIDLASKLGVGPQNWKSLGSYAKAAGEGAWLMYTDAIGRALAGQRKARTNLTGAK
jgi:hypothetical protein